MPTLTPPRQIALVALPFLFVQMGCQLGDFEIGEIYPSVNTTGVEQTGIATTELPLETAEVAETTSGGVSSELDSGNAESSMTGGVDEGPGTGGNDVNPVDEVTEVVRIAKRESAMPDIAWSPYYGAVVVLEQDSRELLVVGEDEQIHGLHTFEGQPVALAELGGAKLLVALNLPATLLDARTVVGGLEDISVRATEFREGVELHDIAVLADGRVLVTAGSGQLFVVDGVRLQTIELRGITAAGFVAVGPRAVYVQDSSDGWLYRLAIEASGELAAPEAWLQRTVQSTGLCVGATGHVYLVESDRLEVHREDGSYAGSIGLSVHANGHDLARSCSVHDGPPRSVYVVSRYGVHVVRMRS